ncbi:MAG: hypothetical protein FWF75_04495 [Propionibacteriaceae bacterium]|nr:hypothetical protein [Propionibacteriaceae bacterium]
MRLGFDTHARPLEVGVIVLPDGELLIIHAMPLRRGWQDLLDQARRS